MLGNNMGSKQKTKQDVFEADCIHVNGLDCTLMLSITVMTKAFEVDVWIYGMLCINSGVTIDALIPVSAPICL